MRGHRKSTARFATLTHCLVFLPSSVGPRPPTLCTYLHPRPLSLKLSEGGSQGVFLNEDNDDEISLWNDLHAGIRGRFWAPAFPVVAIFSLASLSLSIESSSLSPPLPAETANQIPADKLFGVSPDRIGLYSPEGVTCGGIQVRLLGPFPELLPVLTHGGQRTMKRPRSENTHPST